MASTQIKAAPKVRSRRGSPGAGPPRAEENPRSLARLHRQWIGVALLYAAAVAAGYVVLARSWQPAPALQWLALAAGASAVQMGILRWSLSFNHAPESNALFPTLGLANGMTLTRGLLTCLLAGFLLAPLPPPALAWAPALLYGLERVVDFFDGYAARRTRGETRLGAILDIEFDGLGILIAVALAVQYTLLPPWYLLLGLSRPLFVAGMSLRRRARRPLHPLPPSDHRRVIAGLQTGFVAVVLWPIWQPEVARLAGTLFAVPLLFSFGRDWLVVSGALNAGSTRYATLRARAKELLEGWLPLAARLVAAAIAALLLFTNGMTSVSWAALVAATLLAAGVLGRAAALLTLVFAALDALSRGLHWGDNALLLVSSVIVLHLGSGRWALWQPEERLIRRKLGAGEEGAS